jgi:hypothetical protein
MDWILVTAFLVLQIVAVTYVPIWLLSNLRRRRALRPSWARPAPSSLPRGQASGTVHPLRGSLRQADGWASEALARGEVQTALGMGPTVEATRRVTSTGGSAELR